MLSVLVAGAIGGTGGVEPLGRVLADHLEEPIARDTVTFVTFDKRLGYQRRERLERGELIKTQPRRDRGGRVEIEPADAH